MPPKTKTTREMIIDAAFDIAREAGAENINARTVAAKLNCSTQPVLYHLKKIEYLKRAVYSESNRFHMEYLLNMKNPQDGIMRNILLNHIRFAFEEPYLFRFLFQSGFPVKNSLLEMIDFEELKPVVSAIQQAMELSMEQAKESLITIALFAHGYASIIANNPLEYDEKVVDMRLRRAYQAAISATQKDGQ